MSELYNIDEIDALLKKYSRDNTESETKASENKVSENIVSENKVSENKVSENKTSENKVFENKVSEKKESEKKKSEDKKTTIKESENQKISFKKAEEKSFAVKDSGVKSPENKKTEYKLSNNKKTEYKSSDDRLSASKISDAKTPENKISDIKSSDDKSSDVKNPENMKSDGKFSIKRDSDKNNFTDKKVEELRNNAEQRRTEQKKAEKKKNISNAILNILLIIFILIFVASGGYLANYYYKIQKAESKYAYIRNMIVEDAAPVVSDSDDSGDGSGEGAGSKQNVLKYINVNGVSVQAKYAELYRANEDFIGWLTIPGTNIDYPVMFTPDDEEKYLHLDFDKNESASGTLFAAAGCLPLKPSDNILIYGHNMKAGTMFHDLLEYENEDFYKEHKRIIFNTLNNNGVYEVIAAFRTQVDGSGEEFKYYDFFDTDDEKEFNDFVSKAQTMTPYKTTESAEFGNMLLTLSTCAYHTNEGRFVVVAKQVSRKN